MARSERVAETWSLRLERLARNIELLAEKDERSLERVIEIGALRRAAAAELHAICGQFVEALNGLLARSTVELDPPQFHPEAFQEDGANLVQINVRGRILQVEFHATPDLLSTEEFRVSFIPWSRTAACGATSMPAPTTLARSTGDTCCL